MPIYHRMSSILPGLSIALIVAIIAFFLAKQPFFTQLGMSSLVLAMVVGLMFGSTFRVHLPLMFSKGLQFSAKRILRLAVILYGFRITFQDVVEVGAAAVCLDVVIVIFTLILACYVGVRVLKLTHLQSLLIGAGAAICGAAAVLAFESILKNHYDDTAIAVMSVVLFGTLGMFLYPFLQQSGVLGLLPKQYAIYTGATVHEVAQVLVAGSQISVEVGQWAVVVKMVRVMLLVPILFILSHWQARQDGVTGSPLRLVPWFAVGFVLVIIVHSLKILPETWVQWIVVVDVWLLTIAMAALGIETNLMRVIRLGAKPFCLALTLFVWLVIGGYILSRASFVLFSVH